MSLIMMVRTSHIRGHTLNILARRLPSASFRTTYIYYCATSVYRRDPINCLEMFDENRSLFEVESCCHVLDIAMRVPLACAKYMTWFQKIDGFSVSNESL